MADSLSNVRRDAETLLGFVIFPVLYLGLTAIVVRRSMPLSSFAGNQERRELHFAAAIQVLIVATLLASLGHVPILWWMRSKYLQLSRSRFVVQQVVTAALSAVVFLQYDFSLFGAAVLAAPAVITALVYMIGERVVSPME